MLSSGMRRDLEIHESMGQVGFNRYQMKGKKVTGNT
jgi:hypothetical protein